MCKESGLKALSGGYNDIRDIETQAAQRECPRATRAGCFRAARPGIGLVALPATERRGRAGLHGGHRREPAGDSSGGVRQSRRSSASCSTRRRTRRPGATEATISAPESRVKVMVIPTNEELVVAREVKRFLEKPACAPSAVRASRPRKHAPASTQSRITDH